MLRHRIRAKVRLALGRVDCNPYCKSKWHRLNVRSCATTHNTTVATEYRHKQWTAINKYRQKGRRLCCCGRTHIRRVYTDEIWQAMSSCVFSGLAPLRQGRSSIRRRGTCLVDNRSVTPGHSTERPVPTAYEMLWCCYRKSHNQTRFDKL